LPASLEAAAVFSVLIVPGLLLSAGYNRTRAHGLPQRDLYALAQAVVLSLAWLPVIWVLGGNCVVNWANRHVLEDHQGALLWIVGLNLAVALSAGLLAGRLIDAIGSNPYRRIASALAWTGIFSGPTPWDQAWERAGTYSWAAVEIRLATGDQFNVLFDDGSDVGLSPGPRQAFFDTEYRWDGDDLVVLEHEGIFINGEEVISLRFEHLEPYYPEQEERADS
jgi:Family of unknown function (DUF6338)